MNRRFLEFYNDELFHVRHMAAEFAREYPKIAGRLALDTEGREACPDPFVERLIEGFAFLAARVRLKLDAEFPRFTQGLLETVFPTYLSPLPSMGVVQLKPEPDTPPEGAPMERGTVLRSIPGGRAGGPEVFTACTFRTAHPVKLLPIRVESARYFTRDIAELNLPEHVTAAAALRIRIKTLAGQPIASVDYQRLDFFLGGGEVGHRIYEQIFGKASAVLALSPTGRVKTPTVLASDSIQLMGFTPEEALLPVCHRSYDGYRLIREYFAMPERFLFFGLTDLKSAAPQIEGDTLDLVICFNEADVRLERRVQAGNFSLFCTPAINLFPKWADEIELAERFTEFEVVPDKTRPLDYEVFEVLRVEGVGDATGKETIFRPFYWSHDSDEHAEPTYYALRRDQRELTLLEKRFNKSKSKYLGSLVYLSLCDREERMFEEHAAPPLKDLTRLRVQALCTNRHLPIQMAVGQGMTDFDLGGSKVESIRFVVGPTPPQPSHAEGETAWRLISSLSLNYLSLLDNGKDGATALREILSLYCPPLDLAADKQVLGLRSVRAEPVIRRAQVPGPVAMARGLKVSLLFDEDAFSGAGVFLLGAVMARFLGRYVTANSFVETAIQTVQRKEIKRWPASIGTRPII